MFDFQISVPIIKVDEEKRMVWGYATVEELDKTGEIVSYEASKKAFSDWVGNIREQHDPKKAVGKAVEIKFDDDKKAVWVGAFISRSTDGENTWTKVKEEILQGFSIGGKIATDGYKTVKSEDGTEVGVIMDYALTELSLVDNPACPSAMIQMVKSVDGHLQATEEVVETGNPHVAAPWWTKTFISGSIGFAALMKNSDSSYDVNNHKGDKFDMSKQVKKNDAAEVVDPAAAEVVEAAAEVVEAPVEGAEEVVTDPAPAADEVVEVVEDKPAEGAEVVEPDGEKAAKAEVTKSLYDVADLAYCLSGLTRVRDYAAAEAIAEGDGSDIPARLTAALKELAAVLGDMALEEGNEAAGATDATEVTEVAVLDPDCDVELADKPEITKATQEDATKTAPTDVTKAVVAAVEKAVADIVAPQIKELADQVEQIKKTATGKRPVASYVDVDKVDGEGEAADEISDLQKTVDDTKLPQEVRVAAAQKLSRLQHAARS